MENQYTIMISNKAWKAESHKQEQIVILTTKFLHLKGNLMLSMLLLNKLKSVAGKQRWMHKKELERRNKKKKINRMKQKKDKLWKKKAKKIKSWKRGLTISVTTTWPGTCTNWQIACWILHIPSTNHPSPSISKWPWLRLKACPHCSCHSSCQCSPHGLAWKTSANF